MTPPHKTNPSARKLAVLELRTLEVDELAAVTGGQSDSTSTGDLVDDTEEDAAAVRIPVRIKRVP